jgi:hypothetical protein
MKEMQISAVVPFSGVSRRTPKANRRVRYDPAINCICIQVHPGYEYEVDLDRCTTAGAALDWIHQVCVTKTWGREVCSEFLDVLFGMIPCEFWSGKM